jgi:hypothetical protein
MVGSTPEEVVVLMFVHLFMLNLACTGCHLLMMSQRRLPP